jgi:hypothetical protein
MPDSFSGFRRDIFGELLWIATALTRLAMK